MRRVALKGLWLRRGRSLLTTLAVVLGVAMVCGTYVLTDTIDRAFEGIFVTANAKTSAVVTAREIVENSGSGQATVPASLLREVQGVDGVATATGTIQSQGFGTDQVRLIGTDGETIGNGQAPRFGFGFDYGATRFNPFVVTDGRFPRADGEVALDRNTADKNDLRVGDRIGVAAQGGRRPFTVVGVARYGQVSSIGGATIALFTLPVAQRLLAKRDRFDTIAVAADPGVSDTQLADNLRAAVGRDVVVRTGSEQAAEQAGNIEEGTAFLRYFLLAFGLIALGVGAFVIYNTLTITIAQRVRELATLRALGASAQQVRRSVLVEGLALGLLASVIGLVAGYFLAQLLSAAFTAIGVDLPKTDEVLKTRTVVVSFAIGIVVTAVASLAPARRATRISPIAAMQDGAQLGPKLSARRPTVGVAVLAVAFVVLGVGAFAGLDAGPALGLLGGGTLLLFAGASMLAHRAVLPLAGVLGAPVARVAGAPGKLARENAARNPARTASTAGALMIALALVTLVATLGAGLRDSSRKALEDIVSPRATTVVTSDSGFDTMPAAAGRAAASAPGATTYAVRSDSAKAFGDSVSVDGVPVGIENVLNVRTRGGTLVPPAGGAAVAAAYAREHDLEVGSRLALQTPSGTRLNLTVTALQIRTAAQKVDPLLGRVVVSQRTFDRSFERPGDQYVFVAGANRDAVARAVARFPDVTAHTRAGWVEDRVAGIDMLLGLLYVLLGLSVIVSLFGMVNTLVLTVFERTREIGMLRAIGMSRRQVRRMVRWEAVVTSLIGAALGLPLGLLLARLLTSALADQGIGFAIPGVSLVVFAIVAMIAGVLAAIAPARRAARLDVLRALQYE